MDAETMTSDTEVHDFDASKEEAESKYKMDLQ